MFALSDICKVTVWQKIVGCCVLYFGKNLEHQKECWCLRTVWGHDLLSKWIMTMGRVQKKKYGNFHKGGGSNPFRIFFCILNSSRNALKKILWGGVPPQKKSQGSPLWIFWKFFQNFKIYSNNRKIPRVPPLDILEKFSKFQKKFQ